MAASCQCAELSWIQRAGGDVQRSGSLFPAASWRPRGNRGAERVGVPHRSRRKIQPRPRTCNISRGSAGRGWLQLAYDSGLVAGAVPDFATALTFDGDQQAAIGLFCGNQHATLLNPLTPAGCAGLTPFGATRVTIPAPGTENDDKIRHASRRATCLIWPWAMTTCSMGTATSGASFTVVNLTTKMRSTISCPRSAATLRVATLRIGGVGFPLLKRRRKDATYQVAEKKPLDVSSGAKARECGGLYVGAEAPTPKAMSAGATDLLRAAPNLRKGEGSRWER